MATNGIPRRWTVEDSLDLYNIRLWGNDHFSVNPKGNIQVHPEGPGTPAIDLRALVEETLQRGIGLPLLIRFSEILGARVRELNEAFRRAMEEYEYQGVYRGVFPIKVNQERYVVEKLVEAGRPYHFGLEAGSKPELLAVMAIALAGRRRNLPLATAWVCLPTVESLIGLAAFAISVAIYGF